MHAAGVTNHRYPSVVFSWRLIALLALLATLSISAFAGVTITSPKSGASVTSPVSVVASATSAVSSKPITGMVVYVDSKDVYSKSAASVNTSLSMSTGSHTILVKAWNSAGTAYSASVAIKVTSSTPAKLSITTSTLATATLNSGYSETLKATGGTTPYTWSLSSGSLPAGLSLSSTGTISGTPTATGTSTFTVGVKDSSSTPQSATATLSLTVASSVTPPPQASGYKLVFDEEFNSLSLSNTGTGSGYTWYNPGVWFESPAPSSDITLSNGVLGLTWVNGQTPAYDTSISTSSTNASSYKAWTYGYFEVRMKFDPTTGSYPALWLNSLDEITNPSGEYGEVDIFEWEVQTPKTYYGTIHDWMGNKQLQNNNSSNSFPVPSSTNFADFHTYGMLWTSSKITWYFDNAEVGSATPYAIFGEQLYYLVLGQQIGTNWVRTTSGMTTNTLTMNVDWVHVFQQ
jgi:beta-glucanase (GH16 family)